MEQIFTTEFLAAVSAKVIIVVAATELIKKLLKVKAWVAVVLSLVVSAGACLPDLFTQSVVVYALLVVVVWGTANGFFKVVHKPE
jgi:uncharacterized membrane protein (DUF441 family)